MKVTLPDGNELELEDGATGADAAAAIGAGPRARRAGASSENGDGPGPRARRCSDGDRISDHHAKTRQDGEARSSSSATTPRTCSRPR